MRDHVFVTCCLRSGTHPPPSPQTPSEIAHVLSTVNQSSFEDDDVIFQKEQLKITQSVEESWFSSCLLTTSLAAIATLHRHLPKIGDGGCGWGGVSRCWGVSGQGTDGSGCLKVNGRAANWGGSNPNEFFHSLAAPDRWHHLGVLSIRHHRPPPSTLNKPLFFFIPPPHPRSIFLSSYRHFGEIESQRGRVKKKSRKKLFISEQAS